MAVVYKGNVEFEPTGPARVKIRDYDFDEAFVEYQGAAHLLSKFMSSLKRGQPFGNKTRLFLYDWENDNDPIFPTVTLAFLGYASSTGLKRAKVIDSLVPGSATVDGPGDSGVEIEFLANQSQFSWQTDKRPPDYPPEEYRKARIRVKPLITKSRVVLDPDAEPGNISPTLVDRVLDYTREEMIPGQLWRCSSWAILTYESRKTGGQ